MTNYCLVELPLFLEVVDQNPLHVFTLQQSRNSFHDIAAQVELNRNVGILVRFIDSRADGELNNIAVKQHGRKPYGRIGPHVFRGEVLLKKTKHFAQGERALPSPVQSLPSWQRVGLWDEAAAACRSESRGSAVAR